MRKIIVTENLTLDGIMEVPEKWAFAYQTEEMAAVNKEGMDTSDALILGRVTYEELAAYWPLQTDDQTGITAHLNNVSKYVVSTTLEQADWVNTTIISDNIADEIARLKQQPGGNIGVIGSATLVQSLVGENLIDEYHLFVVPIVLGEGKRLFKEGSEMQTMELVETTPFSSGVVLLTYKPVQKNE